MASQAGTKEYNTFVKGLITEASPLTYPEDASLDELNFELKRDGTRRRRLGYAYEDSYTWIDTNYTSIIGTYATSVHIWDNVADNADLSILVIQIGSELFFFDRNKPTISDYQLNGGSSLDIGINGSQSIQSASLHGKLIITTGESNPYYLEYDAATDTVTQAEIIIEIRDYWGIDSGYETDERLDIQKR